MFICTHFCFISLNVIFSISVERMGSEMVIENYSDNRIQTLVFCVQQIISVVNYIRIFNRNFY